MQRYVLAALLLVTVGGPLRAQVSGPRTADDLARLDPAQLNALYMQAPPAPMPSGKVRGVPLVRPGSRLAPAASRGGRVLWQGKVFDPATASATNRFVGVRVISGNLSYGPSWLDGRPSLILDYAGTSHLYGAYRDEIRQVAPGLLLGLMYERTCPRPTFKTFFVLEPCR